MNEWVQTVSIIIALCGSVWAIVRSLGQIVFQVARFVSRVDTLERTQAEMLGELRLIRQHSTPRGTGRPSQQIVDDIQ